MRDRVWLALGGALGVGTLLVALRFTPLGYDFTDEGFYLASMATPKEYVYALSLFGYVYHVPYLVLGGSIAGMRAFNVLVTFALAYWLSHVVVRKFLAPAGSGQAACLSAALAGTSLLILSLNGKWLPTPSYNSLALSATLLVATGLTYCCSAAARAPLGAWLLIGVGGCLAFFAKPTTAAVLVLAVPATLGASGKIEVRGLSLAAFAALVLTLLSAIAISGSVRSFVDLMSFSIVVMKEDGTGHDLASSLLRLSALPHGPRAVAIYSVAAILLGVVWRAGARYSRLLVAILFLAAFAAAVAVQHIGIGNAYAKEAFVQLLLLGAVVVACLLLIVAHRSAASAANLRRQRLALSACFLILPHAYAFGTNNDMLAQASSAGIFWVLGGLLLLSRFVDRESLRRLQPSFAVASAAFAGFVLYAATESPYRQSGPLLGAEVPVRVGPLGSSLRLRPPEASFLISAQRSLADAGMPPGQPLLDLTGKSPGVLFALGAQSVGNAWWAGGYSGSERVALEILRRIPCQELADAWVLTGSSVNALSPTILGSVGASLSPGYVALASWVNPLDADKLTIYKSLRPAGTAAMACERARRQREVN